MTTMVGTNTLTGNIATIYSALDTVCRELVGFIPAVRRNSSAEQAALEQTISYPVTPAATTGNITPGAAPPDDGDQTIGYDTMTISSAKYSPVRWSGEEVRAMDNTFGTINVILRDQFAQSMRALVNLIEADLFAAARKGASRAYGTAGTAPFPTAANLSDFAGILQILDQNGSQSPDRHLVLGAAAMANLRGVQSVLFKVNEAGTSELLRQGVIGQVEGLMLHNSAAVKVVAKGTGASYIVNGTTIGIGTTTVPVDTGSGTILAGDVLTFTGDTNQYVVKTGITAAGNLVLNNPGRLAASADNDAVTVVGVTAGFTPNVAFVRDAIHLVTRAPAMPSGGDMADDVTTVTDALTGLSFQVALYRQYHRVKYEVGIVWGCKAVKSEDIALLLG